MIKAIGKHIIATDMDIGEEVSSGGIVLQDTIGKMDGDRRARWFTIVSVGDRSGFQDDLKEHDKVLVDYGRWTKHIEADGIKYWGIDPTGISAIEIVT